MHEITKKPVFYASKEAHPCMEKSCKMTMVRCRSVPTEERNNWGMTAGQLEQDILKDKERGLVPGRWPTNTASMSMWMPPLPACFGSTPSTGPTGSSSVSSYLLSFLIQPGT